MKCDGECKQCEGEIRTVHVTDEKVKGGADWGYYEYCDIAIADDRRDGFTVAEITDKF